MLGLQYFFLIFYSSIFEKLKLTVKETKKEEDKVNEIKSFLKWRRSWSNGYRRKKWKWRLEFNFWTWFYYIAQLFSFQQWVNSRTDCALEL